MLANISNLNDDYQKTVLKGVESLFTLQKQVLDGTFDLYEKGLVLREGSYTGTKKRVEDVTEIVEKQIGGGHEKVRATVLKFVESYMPESQDKVEKLEELVQSGIGSVTGQMKSVVTDNLDQTIQKSFNYERDIIKQMQEMMSNYLAEYQEQVYNLLGVKPEKKEAKPAAKKAASKPSTAKKPAAKKTTTRKTTVKRTAAKSAEVKKEEPVASSDSQSKPSTGEESKSAA